VKPAKLHLTLGMLKLFRAEDVTRAAALLKKLAANVYDAVGERKNTQRPRSFICLHSVCFFAWCSAILLRVAVLKQSECAPQCACVALSTRVQAPPL
jgi:hypothetical protein